MMHRAKNKLLSFFTSALVVSVLIVPRSPAQSLAAPTSAVEPVPAFAFSRGLAVMTGYSLLQAQNELRAALGYNPHSDPNDFLAFRLPFEEGSELLWASTKETSTLETIMTTVEVATATDADNHDTGLFVASCILCQGSHVSQAYLLMHVDHTEGIGAALPITAETWDAMFPFSGSADLVPASSDKTCAELAVDWCTDWCPPCDPSQVSGIGGLIGCFEQAKCNAEDCHHLACITNAADCCEREHGRTYCWWEQYLTQGHNLEHVTCDVVLELENGQCLAELLAKVFE